ncbi:hypothetical protein [Variovorax durovernensis]
MIMDGGMMAPRTSLFDRRMFTNIAGIVMPAKSMTDVVVIVTAPPIAAGSRSAACRDSHGLDCSCDCTG